MISNKLKQNKYPTGILLLTILILGLLVPHDAARAFIDQWTVSLIFNLVISWFVTNIVNPIINVSIAVVTILLYQTTYFPEQVAASWNLIRNFLNMFFIVILIIMAFGTIFDIDKYRLGNLLPKFLIAALLINFSFVIGKYIITVANGLSNVFLSSITDILGTLGQGLSQQMITKFSGVGIGSIITGSITTGFIYLIFLIISLIAYATMAIFLLVRIPFLWFLLILSPVAWLGLILPNFRAKTWDDWWKNFIGWTFFLPVYIFFLTFATIFINAKNQIAPPRAASMTALGNISGLFTDIFMFAITIIIMIGGLGLAAKMSFFAGTRAVKIFGGIEGGVKKYFPGRRYGETIYEGAKEGLKARVEGIKEGGVPVGFGKRWFSERQARLRQAGVAEFFGAKGAADKQLAEEVNKLKGNYEKITDMNRLGGMINTGSTAQRLAAREVMKERGQLSVDQMLETYNLYGGRRSLAGLKFARGIDFGQLSGRERDRLYNGMDDPEIRRKIINVMADKGDLRRRTRDGETEDQFLDRTRNYLTLFPQEGDRREFLNKMRKYTFEAALRIQTELGFIRDAAGNTLHDFTAALQEQVRRMKMDEVFELSHETLRGLLEPNTETRRIIRARLTKEVVASIPGKVNAQQLAEWNDILAETRVELEGIVDRQTEQQTQAQARAMEPLVNSIRDLVNEIRRGRP